MTINTVLLITAGNAKLIISNIMGGITRNIHVICAICEMNTACHGIHDAVIGDPAVMSAKCLNAKRPAAVYCDIVDDPVVRAIGDKYGKVICRPSFTSDAGRTFIVESGDYFERINAAARSLELERCAGRMYSLETCWIAVAYA